MAFDLVSAYATTSDDPFFKVGESVKTLTEAPQQITLRFSTGITIDPTTLGSIAIVRSGGAADGFGVSGTKADVQIVPGSISVDALPDENQVVIRFAETLPDDTYRITVGAGLKTTADDTATPRSFDFRVNVGSYVVAVVPQPVARTGATLAQNRDVIEVYFNRNDPLSVASAQNPSAYRLFQVDQATGNDVAPLNPVNPASVAYDAATGKAVLTFAGGVVADGRLYRLQIGAAEALVTPAAPVAEGSDDNSSFVTARNLGVLDSAGKKVDGSISRPRAADSTQANRGTLATPAGSLQFPPQFGPVDEPGHRWETFIPTDSHEHGLPGWATRPDGGALVRVYGFPTQYGVDGQGNPLINAISETQKQRVREVFDLFSSYTGLRFIESNAGGLQVVTGDVRALNPLTPPAAVAGLASFERQIAIMSSLVDWGSNEYGGRYFQVAMHEIGHALGLEHSYDIPSIMGAGLAGEPVFPGDYDNIHLAQLYPAIGSDVDTYRFTVATAGTFSAETVIARPGQVAKSPLDSVLSLYREDAATGKRELIARNDDYYGRDSFVGLDLEPGTYFVAVSSTGNTSFNPEVSDSGYGGRSSGDYRLELDFQPRSSAVTTLSGPTPTDTLFDGDRDGKAGGAFKFWFKTAASTTDAGTNRTLFVDKAAYASLAAATSAGANGTLGKPFYRIQDAIAAATPGSIVRIIGNTAGPLGVSLPYLVGTDLAGNGLEDGATFNVPKGVTVLIDENAVIKLRAAIIDVGSSSQLVDRGGAAIQVLGTPDRNVIFSSYHDDFVGGDSDKVGPVATGGQWGGLVLRKDSDSASKKAFVNSIANASIRYGGGQVLVDSSLESFAPIQLESTRPTIAFNTITDSAGAAIAADPNSFEDSNGRVGPEIRGNRLVEVRSDRDAPHQNSINGLFVKIRTNLGQPLDKLDVPARFTSTDIVYVLQETLLIDGGAGGYLSVNGTDAEARRSGSLAIDPGVVVKLRGSRIELGRGTSQFIAEGTAAKRVVFTSLGDNRFGAGGTFDTNGNQPDIRSAGDWGGIVLNAGAKASIDYAYIAFGGGATPIEGSFDRFNVIETHQGDLRVAHSRIESNAAGTATTTRGGRGGNAAATIFVRGAQPVILDNDFRDNAGAVISINANSLSDLERPDMGRSTGFVDRDRRYDDNSGPLIRGNRLPFDRVAGSISGLVVRGEEITVESVWDDTDIVHVLLSEIIVQNFHTATGIRLMSRSDASLVVKLAGANAGFTASGYQLDIGSRIGGTLQIVGQPNYPVVLTSLRDDTVGASVDPRGRTVKDTANDGETSPAAGDWRGLAFYPYSNDRNVAIVQEAEKPSTGGVDVNSVLTAAQSLGVLAPNFATGSNTSESAQEKSGDENRRLGFEVHGRIADDDASDVDAFTFFGYSGSEAWIDVDKSSAGLDAMIELLDASGKVLACSADGQTDASLDAATRGIGQDMRKNDNFGGDFYSLNPKDPGMRVVLPGLPGTLAQYFVRIRSQPRYEPATTGVDNGSRTATGKAAYEADLRDAAKLKSGATSGGYELRIRLRQQDEKPGSTVRHADIRYPEVGIDVQGLPRNSPLVGEAGETSANNDTSASAQYVGNLLQSDRNAISIAGQIQSRTDVDWYTFALNHEQIQSIAGVNNGLKSWATVFDIDYGDALRGDLTLSVFNAAGQLIYVGRDSNIASDQPGVGQGNDFDDLSRGSLGKLDPFIGSVQLPVGPPTGGGSIEAGVPVTAPNPAAQLRYFVAVSSNQRLPDALEAYFRESSTNSLIRLEPVDSVRRIAEDHIGFDGYLSGPNAYPYPSKVNPSQSLFNISSAQTLSLHATPFTLSDVTLFVYTATSIETVDAMRGGNETTLYRLDTPPPNPRGDLAMRSDGKLFQYRPTTNAGGLYGVDTVSGGTTLVGDDNIPVLPPAPPVIPQITAIADTVANRTSFAMPALVRNGSFAAELNVSYSDTTGGNSVARLGSWRITQANNGTLTFTPLNVDGNSPEIDAANTRIDRTARDGAAFGVLTIAWTSKYLPVPDAAVNLLNVAYLVDNPNAVTTTSVDAMAFRRLPVEATVQELYYSVREGERSRLYRGNVATGDAATGRIGTTTIGDGGLGVVTGLAFVNDTMFGVDALGNFFRFGVDDNGRPTTATSLLTTVYGGTSDDGSDPPATIPTRLNASFSNGQLSLSWTAPASEDVAITGYVIEYTPSGGSSTTVTTTGRTAAYTVQGLGLANGTSYTVRVAAVSETGTGDFSAPATTTSPLAFAGLATGPQNLQNGAFANRLFAITNDGRLYCFGTDGMLQEVFDANGDGRTDATSIASGSASGVLGLAFSPLDVNLWHPTVRRGNEAGHGISIAPNETRNELDNEDFAVKYQSGAPNRKFLMEEGGASMYFGLEKYVRPTGNSATPYLNYESFDGQLGVLSGQWQRDLTTVADTMIGNNYNLPGGAYGSLITNSFSLANSTYNDKPTLYFNYWLKTEQASGAFDQNDMRDSARVFVSANGGPWQVVATNNSTRSAWGTDKGELPNFVSASAALTTKANQRVQELYDTESWRQARIDLGGWAGQSNLRLRFDFSTAGEFDAAQRDANGNLINQIAGYAGTTGNFSGDEQRSRERGRNNDHEGFYVDDVIIGFAERGEMVTGGGKNQTNFFDIVTPDAKAGYLAEQSLTGPYQLEIRRGLEYGVQPDRSLPDVAIRPGSQFNTNDDLVFANGGLGDANQPREQGQFLIENNSISNASTYGIRIDAAAREAGTNNAVPGTPRNLPTLNAARLVPGVVVTNNLITGSGTAGILFSGDPSTGAGPAAGVPIGRIVNNTIHGGTKAAGIGVDVSDNAAPTILNNLFANLATGIRVDPSSRSTGTGSDRTVVGYSAYYEVATPVSSGVAQDSALTLTTDPFVKASRGNFYLAAGSSAIDSGLNTLGERSAYTNVANSIAIPESPVVAPDRDLYGQLRGDDPGQPNASGLGSNVFKDRGAIERIDFAQPSAVLAVPLDNSTADQEAAANEVRLVRDAARGVTRFELQLNDNGVGIDKATVVSTAFQLRWKGEVLTPGTHYVFNYLESSNRVVFESPSVFSLGTYVISVVQTTGTAPLNVVTDLAGNPLLANRPDGTTTFKVDLVDVPAAPTGLVGVPGNGQVALSWNTPSGDTPLDRYEVQQSTVATFAGATTINVEPPTVSQVVSPLDNGTPYWFRVRAVNTFGESGWSNVVGPVVPGAAPTLALGTGIAGGATAAEATQVSGVVTVSGASNAAITVTFQRGTGTPVVKTLTGIGSPQPVVLTSDDVTTLGNGLINVSATQAVIPGSTSPAATTSFAIDTVVPLAPNLALGTGVANGASAPEATQASGVVTVSGESSAAITVTFRRGAGTPVTKTLTGTGSPQPVVLTTADLTTLGDGLIAVSATQVDAAGNPQTAPAATTSFTLDTVAPPAPNLTLGNGIANGATAAEATQASGVAIVSGVSGATITVIFQRETGTPVTKTLTGTGSPQAVVLTAPDLTTLGNGVINVSAIQTSVAGNPSVAATISFRLDTVAPPAPNLALGTGVADGASAVEATQASGVVTVSGESSAAITVTFRRGAGTPVTKTLTGTGSPQPVVLTSDDVTTLGDGLIAVSATQVDAAGNPQTAPAATTSFTLDTQAPPAPNLALGNGIANGATAAEATQASGVAIVSGVSGATITVIFQRETGTPVTKILTGTGSPQAVVLTAPDLTTLGNGVINVSAIQTSAAGNPSVAATISFRLDTVAPPAPNLALGNGIANGATAVEATQASGVVTVSGDSSAAITVTFQRAAGTPVTKTLTGTGSPQPVVLTSDDVTTLGDGLIAVSATQVDAAGNPQTAPAATTSFTLDTVPSGVPVISGNLPSGSRTNVTTPTLTGRADPGASVALSVGATVLGVTVADASGNWLLVSPALGNGRYQVIATASDPAGNTSRSAVYDITIDTVNAITPAPTRLTARAGRGVVNLAWTASTVPAGTAILDYVIQYSVDGGRLWITMPDPVSSLTRATVTVPVSGVSYIFRVAAQTAAGIGLPSTASAAVTPSAPVAPAALPGVPTALNAARTSSGSVGLTWVAPAINAGGSVTGYVIQYRLATSTTWKSVAANSTRTSAKISRLTAGRTYVFRVAARNLTGVGTFSSERQATA